MRSVLVSVALVVLAATSWAKPAEPVTQAEAYGVFSRAAQMLSSVLNVKIDEPSKPAQPQQPVTRLQVIENFYRLFEASKSKFRFTPKPVSVDKKRLNVKDSIVNQHIQKMIAFGTVAPVGPLATGPKETLSVQEFSEALGFFLVRMAELTHMPEPKWSPPLMDDRTDAPKKGARGKGG